MAKFRMFEIHADQFATLVKEMPNEDLGFNVGLSYKYANNGKIIACSSRFTFTSREEKILVIEVTCDFEIAEESWTEFVKDKTVTIPKSLLEFFAVHTVGTTRGIMFCKTENTSFNKLIIPPLNVSDMVQGDLIINIPQE